MSNAPIAGMNYPTQKAMLAGNPRDSAMQAATNSDVKLANMGKIGGKRIGRKRIGRKRRGGAVAANAQTIPVPQYQMLYTPQGGDNSNPNSQIQQSSRISTQGAANAVNDKLALTGGTRKYHRCKKGGNSNWSWGCYSGGKKTSRKQKRSRKSIKSRKSRKH